MTPKLKRKVRSTDPLVPMPILDYVNRKVEGDIHDFELFDYARENHYSVLIEGPTGAGKTMAVEAYAGARGLRFQSVACNAGIDPSQFFGRVIPREDGSLVWQDGVVTDMVRKGGVLLFNEINFLPERISTVLFSLFDRRRTITLLDHTGETVQAHPDLFLIMDMNPGYLGTRPLNAAFRNRQSIQTVWDYNPDVEKKLTPSKSLLDMFVRLRRSEGFSTPFSTNMLVEFGLHAKSLGYSYAVGNFLNHVRLEERPSLQQIVDSYETSLCDELGLNVSTTPTWSVVSESF